MTNSNKLAPYSNEYMLSLIKTIEAETKKARKQTEFQKSISGKETDDILKALAEKAASRKSDLKESDKNRR